MRRLVFLAVLGLAFGTSASSAQGGFIFFDNRAAFDAATSGRTLIDFEGIAPDGDNAPVPPGGISGVNFTTTVVSVQGDFVVTFAISGKGQTFPGTSVLGTQQSTLDPDIVATLPGSYRAFAV